MPLTLQSLIQAIEKATYRKSMISLQAVTQAIEQGVDISSLEAEGSQAGLDVDILIQELKKMEEKEKRPDCGGFMEDCQKHKPFCNGCFKSCPECK